MTSPENNTPSEEIMILMANDEDNTLRPITDPDTPIETLDLISQSFNDLVTLVTEDTSTN